ncbi:uncharacterized protein LOC120428987 [Culex pipiens pallens]|uniref:uncharacterized protein LOC120428987 n=1 Tax=Culex pipiens pallens TaxID=42434 RepID=UPI001954349F|nr:uncharacterized protein LOC120428987 [Culex pipiens pallens]
MEQVDCTSEQSDAPANNAEPMDQEPLPEVVDLTEDVDVEKDKEPEVPAKKRKPVRKAKVKRLTGMRIERFRFLLKQGYPFETAFYGACRRPHFELVASSVALGAIARRSEQDPWMYEMLYHDEKRNEKHSYSGHFRQSFHTLIEQGESVEDALALARRETDTRTVLETPNGLCDPKTFEGKIRIIIGSTRHPEEGITTEEFRQIIAEMRTNLAKIKDIRYIPHLVECTLVPGTGYILVICGDAITVRWVRLTLKWMTLWPGASLFMVREEKFLASCIMTLSIPDGIARKLGDIMKQLKVQNRKVKIDKWSVLTAEQLDKQRLNKLTIMLPLKDLNKLKTLNSPLHYINHKLRLVAPEDRTSIGKRALFRGFFRVKDMETKDLFKEIESANEGVAVTDEWKQLHRRTGRIMFFVDAASARAIRAAGDEINFQSTTVKLVYHSRVSEI